MGRKGGGGGGGGSQCSQVDAVGLCPIFKTELSSHPHASCRRVPADGDIEETAIFLLSAHTDADADSDAGSLTDTQRGYAARDLSSCPGVCQ